MLNPNKNFENEIPLTIKKYYSYPLLSNKIFEIFKHARYLDITLLMIILNIF